MRLRVRTPERWLPAIVGATLGFHPLIEADTFWHLMLGRAVLRHGTRSVPEPTAFRAWSEPCVAMEWLWDVFTFALVRAAGERASSMLTVVFGATIGWLVAFAIERHAAGSSRALRCALGVVVVSAVADLLNVRPNLAFLTLLAAYVELSCSYVDAPDPRSKLRFGVALVVLAQLWAQLHTSFAVALPIFVIVLAPHWRAVLQPEALARPGAIILGVLLTFLLGPNGRGVVDLVPAHTGGDAVQHIADMKPLSLASIAPFAWPLGAALCILVSLPIWAFISGAKLDAAGIMLALLGASLAWTARSCAIAWVLFLPLAELKALTHQHTAGSARLHQIDLVSVLVALCLCIWAYRRSDTTNGPMLHAGARVGAFPVAAAAVSPRPLLTQTYSPITRQADRSVTGSTDTCERSSMAARRCTSTRRIGQWHAKS